MPKTDSPDIDYQAAMNITRQQFTELKGCILTGFTLRDQGDMLDLMFVSPDGETIHSILIPTAYK